MKQLIDFAKKDNFDSDNSYEMLSPSNVVRGIKSDQCIEQILAKPEVNRSEVRFDTKNFTHLDFNRSILNWDSQNKSKEIEEKQIKSKVINIVKNQIPNTSRASSRIVINLESYNEYQNKTSNASNIDPQSSKSSAAQTYSSGFEDGLKDVTNNR